MDKLSIANEMAQFDRKNREFYDSLTDEERRKFSPYLMIRWGSSVGGSADLQAWYLMSTNERVNKNFFDVSTSKHKKFQWLMCTTISPGMGNQRHYWLAPKKTERDNKAVKFLIELYPELKPDDIELLAKLNTKEDLRNLARQHGWDDRRIKSDL